VQLQRRVRSGGLDIYCYLGVGQDDFPLGVEVLCAVFLHLHNQITILVQATEVGPGAAILWYVCVRVHV